jgi:RNA polymerase subunit RPABC4/transcription elongation factor Spt4
MEKAKKIQELNGKNVITREEAQRLRGKVVVLNPEEGEIAKHLEIKEKGVFGINFR